MNIDAPQKNHIPALQHLWQEAFGDTTEFINTFFRTAFRAEQCRCVTINENVIAALYWFHCLHMGRSVAYLYAVATSKAYRGQGICHKLMEDTHLHLTKLGYEGVILVPGNQNLFGLYESIGYQTCSYIQEFSCPGTGKDIPLWQIDKNEYAKIRRQLLPTGGIIQENENLDFLQTQVHFYTGPGFLLAARDEADILYGVELLGDESAAPKIVQTLGYTKGTFHCPGAGVPFAMYYPLKDYQLSPLSYFGLAFD